MRLPGIVTNVTAFGAFVDIGVHQDGLVHVSELSDTFVRDPHEVVKPQQRVNVYVLEVDAARKRISLSMKSNPQKRVHTAGDARKTSPRPSGNGGTGGGFGRRAQQPQSFGNSFGDLFNNANLKKRR